MSNLLLLGRPGAGVDLGRALGNLAGRPGSVSQLRAGFAYVTRYGLIDALSAIEASDALAQAQKQWLIGVHHAISEPVAIQRLAELKQSRVRLAVCGESIRNAIRGHRVFHAKLLAVNWTMPNTTTSLLVGSANLTRAAQGQRARNYEIFLGRAADLRNQSARMFDAWWNEAWHDSIPATSSNLRTYIRQRDKFVRENPYLIDEAAPAASELAQATTLWIEAGSMSGGARNQVEFNIDLARFFGPVKDHTRLLTITRNGRLWDDRPLSPKRTTFKVRIWRLSLPPIGTEPWGYAGRTLVFGREGADEETARFTLTVMDTDGAEATELRQMTHRNGVVSRTGGGRWYGYM